MAAHRRKAQWGHYPPVVPETQETDSGITVEYNTNGALQISADYGLIDTGNPGDGISFTGPDAGDGSYVISANLSAGYGITLTTPGDGTVKIEAKVSDFDGDYLRNDGDTGVGSYEFTGALTNNGNQVWHPGNDGSGSGLDADLLEGYHGAATATGDTVVIRNAAADMAARLFKSSYLEQTTAPSSTADVCFRNNNTSDSYMRFMSREAMINFTLPGQTYVRAKRTSSQTISSGTTTVILFNVEDTDRLGEYNTTTGRFYPTYDGVYQVSCAVLLAKKTLAISKFYEVTIFRNGVKYAGGASDSSQASSHMYASSHVSSPVVMSSGNYVDCRYYHDFGSAVTTFPSGAYVWLSIVRVG